jgi:hypothetical protein
MFDPLFPVALFGGPLAFAILLRIEDSRSTPSLWPKVLSMIMMIFAIWGILYWLKLIAIALFGSGMNIVQFIWMSRMATAAATLFVVGSYLRIALRRRKRTSPYN